MYFSSTVRLIDGILKDNFWEVQQDKYKWGGLRKFLGLRGIFLKKFKTSNGM